MVGFLVDAEVGERGTCCGRIYLMYSFGFIAQHFRLWITQADIVCNRFKFIRIRPGIF